MSEPNDIQMYAMVELFGHAKIAGLVTEQVIAGQSFLRVDPPPLPGIPSFTRFFGPSAVYSLTPVSQDVAEAMAKVIQIKPVETYYLPASSSTSEDEDDDEEEEGDEDGSWAALANAP